MHLGIVTSHPIQYQAPLFRALAKRVDLTVYFAHQATGTNQAEAGFDTAFEWDTDLTGGFRHKFLANVAGRASITRFDGCDTPSVRDHLSQDKIDVIVVYGWHLKTYMQTAKAARAIRIPVMARTDSHLRTPRPFYTRLIKAATYPRFMRSFDFFLATGSRSAEYLRRYRVPSSRVHIVPYCIDVEQFSAAAQRGKEHRPQLRAKFGAINKETLVVFVGKLLALKNIPLVLDAVERMHAAGKSVRFLIVGSGPLLNQLSKTVSRRGLPVFFTGFVNQQQMPEIYAAADVLVLPSTSETWGLVVNEAFSCGLPAIVSDRVGCGPDMIKDGLTGSIIRTDDAAGLANAVEYWAHAHDSAETQRALQEMSMRYSPRNSAAAFIDAAETAVSILGRKFQ